MLKKIIVKLLLFITIVFYQMPLVATMLATGNGTANVSTFAQTITAKVFDRNTGTLFFGLGPGAGNASISSSAPANGVTVPQFFGIASMVPGAVEFLALSTFQDNPAPSLALVQIATAPLSQKIVKALNNTGMAAASMTTSLLDAGTTFGINGSPTAGIVALAANSDLSFTAVKPSGGQFGQANSGIALVPIPDFVTTATALLQMQQIPAVPGDPAIKAQRVDPSTSQLSIGIFSAPPTITPNLATLFWDDQLQRLYIGLETTTGPTPLIDGAKSIVAGLLNNDETLTLLDIADDTVFAPGVTTNIIGTYNNGTAQKIGAKIIRTMHTSTGASYLIVLGGVVPSTSAVPGNTIYALPLVDLADATNPLQGIVANKNSFNASSGTFQMPATTPADMVMTTDPFALVGGQALAVSLTITGVDGGISDMVVIDDAVYVSIGSPASATSETGIWYSQAEFDEMGKIARWTQWSKRIYPVVAFNTTAIPAASQGRISFFDVDAATGNVWGALSAPGMGFVSTSAWDLGSDAGSPNPTTLPGVLNQTLEDGCFSVLDLDQSTNALGTQNQNRYALFGGMHKVVFARLSISQATAIPFNQIAGGQAAPQIVTTNFSSPGNFLETTLPPQTGCITCLEFSRRVNIGQGYFFAGTQDGLYVFADSVGNGFTTANLGALNNPPFGDGFWQKFPGITGTVVSLKTSGFGNLMGVLYVLAQTPTTSTLYSIPYASNISTMASNVRSLASSGVNVPGSDLSQATMFFGMEIITTQPIPLVPPQPNGAEQLVLATNNGMYRTSALESGASFGTISALNQAAALWTPVSPNDTSLYNGVFGMDTLNKTTVWPTAVANIDNSPNTFEGSVIKQLAGSINANPFNFVPGFFNAKSYTENFQTLDPITYFWSDGGRRLFLMLSGTDPLNFSTLVALPWNNQQWNIVNPIQQIITSPSFAGEAFFYWIKQLGATGILMAGSNGGVVALE